MLPKSPLPYHYCTLQFPHPQARQASQGLGGNIGTVGKPLALLSHVSNASLAGLRLSLYWPGWEGVARALVSSPFQPAQPLLLLTQSPLQPNPNSLTHIQVFGLFIYLFIFIFFVILLFFTSSISPTPSPH